MPGSGEEPGPAHAILLACPGRLVTKDHRRVFFPALEAAGPTWGIGSLPSRAVREAAVPGLAGRWLSFPTCLHIVFPLCVSVSKFPL